MPREQTITVTRGSVRREYLVVYRDDPPERAEAVRFFQEHADSLFPSMAIPPEVEEMPIQEANAYLRRHRIQEQWDLLTVAGEDPYMTTTSPGGFSQAPAGLNPAGMRLT